MEKRFRSWSNPTSIFATAAGLLRRRSSIGTYGSYQQTQMVRRGIKQRRRSGRSYTRTKRRFLGRRRNNAKRRISRIWKYMRRKGLRNIETKYIQESGVTSAGWVVGTDTQKRLAIGTLSETAAGNPPATVNFGSYRLHVTDIGQGSSHETRVGNKVFVKDFKFRGMIEAHLESTAPRELYFKMMVVRVKDAQGFGADASNVQDTYAPYVKQFFDFFEDAGEPNAPIAPPGKLAFINTWKYYNNRLRDDFTILKTKVLKLSNEEGADMEKKLIKFNLRVNQPAQWDGTEPQDGHIYVYWFVDAVRANGAVVGQENVRPVMHFTWRTTYTDV